MQHIFHMLCMVIFSSDFASVAYHISPTEIYSVAYFVIFLESASFFFLFLPGDSLLFILGILLKQGTIHGPYIILLTTVAALLGNICNYYIGQWIGERILTARWHFLSPSAIQKSHEFFNRYGFTGIILARFVPLFRSFIPFLSGMVAMKGRLFLLGSAIGGILWSVVAIGAGYLLGEIPFLREHVSLLFILAMLLSLGSFLLFLLKQYWSRK